MKARGSEGQRVAVSAGQSCGVLEETGVVVLAGVHKKVKGGGPNKEEVQDENVGGRQEQDNEGDVEEWKVGFHKLPKGVNREASVGDHESKEHLSEKVWSVAELESENWTRTKGAGSCARGKNTLREDRGGWRRWKVVSTPGQASEVVMKASLGEMTEQWNE
ncbi:hypothetical protein EDC04DRAFT_2599652 [Pisolithus marmoratus]|nr:hypothetical protein EDC04DRAFT_2599652 [Pisolithus marmoratus]